MQSGVAGKAGLYLVGPLVGGGIATLIQIKVHRLGVIHLVNVGHRLYREEYQLFIGIAIFIGQRNILTQSLGLKFQILVGHLLELAAGKVVGAVVHHLGGGAAVVFAVKIKDSGGFNGLIFTELFSAELKRVVEQIFGIEIFRILRHIKEQRNGVFHWF